MNKTVGDEDATVSTTLKIEFKYLKENLEKFIKDYEKITERQDNQIYINKDKITELVHKCETIQKEITRMEQEADKKARNRMWLIGIIFAAMQGIGAILAIVLL